MSGTQHKMLDKKFCT